MGTGKSMSSADVARVCAWVTSSLEAAADPDKAGPMAAYMKTTMPFFGVQSTARKAIERDLRRLWVPADRDGYERVVRALWRLPHREEKYVAITAARQHRAFITPASLPLYEHMIRTGQWWDLVDEIAAHLVGRVVQRYPDQTWPIIDRWIDDDDMWIRRTAIICQLRLGQDTDEARLFRYCLARAGEPEFFIRKAIGWALRDYARTRPDRVRAFLAEHGDALSGLSRREAAKHL